MTATVNIRVFDSKGNQVDCGIVSIDSSDGFTFSGRYRSRSDSAIVVSVPSNYELRINAYIDRAVVLIDQDSGSIYKNSIPCDYNFYHTVYNGTVFLSDGQVYNKDIYLSTVRGAIEMGYDEILFNGRNPLTIDPYSNIPVGSPLHFLWGVANFIGGTKTATATVNASIVSWDEATVLWTQQFVAEKTLTYLDDVDLGPIDFNLPAGVSGFLKVNLAFSGIDVGTITYPVSNAGKKYGFKIQVGVNPSQDPPSRTGTGVGEFQSWAFDGESTPTVKPGAVFTASFNNNCNISQGDPDADQYAMGWALLTAYDVNNTAYWSTLVKSALDVVPADGGRVLSLSYTLPSTLVMGTLTVQYGSTCVNRWAAYSGYNPCKNIIPNPGFETAEINQPNSPVKWQPYTNGHRLTTFKHSGLASVGGIFSSPIAFAYQNNTTGGTPVKPNTTYKIGGWCMGEVGAKGRLYLDFSDIANDIALTCPAFDGQWHWVETTFTTNSTTTNLKIRLVHDNNTGNTKTVAWDDLSMVEGVNGVLCDPATTPKINSFPATSDDTITISYPITICKAGIASVTPSTTNLAPGGSVIFSVDIKNNGNANGIIGAMMSYYNDSGVLVDQSGIFSDDIEKQPGAVLSLAFPYTLPTNYTGQYIQAECKAFHWV